MQVKNLGHRVIKHCDLGTQLVGRRQRNSKPSILLALCVLVVATMRPVNGGVQRSQESYWKHVEATAGPATGHLKVMVRVARRRTVVR